MNRTTLDCVLDEILPAREDPALPGAGALGIGSYVIDKLGDARPLIATGLETLDQLAVDRGAPDFASAPADLRVALLNEVATGQPGLLQSLVFHGYCGYYRDPRVIEALGLEARPPYPEGYPLESGDLKLLDPVRARPRLFRDPGA
ncbi:MAG: gluconate 2-dehydrogenase subunit 3 family protein [Myxococcota bacterium]|nr:hypothetical protein [Deltaproteobacteria bacterium]MCP4241759.1 gluconate 2-dehydrogenase subunit 3 family protein [bacterium]MDP6075976.1 gluconate 2-dehydrogenase subunit 3 family protein [Myxococcota bacterium]MDP6242359.1 gluconate 2-dehydrogenase subunit 3 family protein [Myxococcota bacterium]MDP7076054.1 gluconate 2-dehydrogenase subunit 3 family protein [Myxococcota bacterium]